MSKKYREPWYEYAMRLAFVAASRSEDPFVKVGACALRHDHTIAAVGYNGAPPKVEIDWCSRDERRKRVVHAEANCLRYCKPGEVKLLACTLMPCINCFNLIASYGIKEVYFSGEDDRSDSSSFLANEYGIKLVAVS